MSAFFNNKEISSVYFGSKTISAIYKGSVLIWEAIRSCFGKGFWVNTYGWNNENGWKNNS